MKIINEFNKELIKRAIEKTKQKFSIEGPLDAFLYLDEFLSRSGIIDNDLFDIKIELLTMLNADDVKYQLLSKKASLFLQNKEYKKMFREIISMAKVLSKTEKYKALNTLLEEFDLYQIFKENNPESDVYKWYNDDKTDLEKINFSLFRFLTYLLDNDVNTNIEDFNIYLNKESIYYNDNILLLANLYLNQKKYKQSIDICNKISDSKMNLRKYMIIFTANKKLKNTNASTFFYNKLIHLCTTNYLQSNDTFLYLHMLSELKADLDIYNICSYQLKYFQLDYRYLYNKAVACYNLQKYEELEQTMKILKTVFPSYPMFELIVYDAKENNQKYLKYISKLNKELTNKVHNDFINSKNNSITKQNSLIILTLICQLDFSDMQIYAKKNQYYKYFLENVVLHPLYNNEFKAECIQALYMSGDTFSYYIKQFQLFNINFINKEKLIAYGNCFLNAYLDAINFFVYNLENSESIFNAINFATQFVLDCVNNENVKNVKNKADILTVIIFLYLRILYKTPEYKNYAKIKGLTKNYYEKFDKSLAIFDLKIIDDELYWQDNKIDIVKAYSTYSFKL